MPFVARVASGRLPLLRVFGHDWPTPDGTGVRDYVHVVDLARGHIVALAELKRKQGSFTVNLGTGRGYSVLEVIAAFERASGRRVPYEFAERRSGDVAVYYAATGMARLAGLGGPPGSRPHVRGCLALAEPQSVGLSIRVARPGREACAHLTRWRPPAAAARPARRKRFQQHALVLAAAVGVLAHQVLGAHRLAPRDGAQQVFVIGLGAQYERRFQQ